MDDVEVQSDCIHLHNLHLETDNGKVYFLSPNLNMKNVLFSSIDALFC